MYSQYKKNKENQRLFDPYIINDNIDKIKLETFNKLSFSSKGITYNDYNSDELNYNNLILERTKE